MLKHENCDDVAFQIMARRFEGKTSEQWSGFWWTIGTTGLYRTMHDTFFVQRADLPKWREFNIPVDLELIR